jgi:hypothetical protein
MSGRARARARARALVEKICDKHGYIPQEVLDRIHDTDREVVVRAMQRKDDMIGSSIMTYDPVPSHKISGDERG